MARPQTNGYEYDTIDLTLSSPEPEPQPRPSQHVRAPPRQTQLYFGHQPRPYSLPRVKNEPSQPAAFSPAPAAAQQTRLIHPTHLREIVSTTSPYALQKVILEMCQISPAFSGALVRGLAPYSTSAQTMMNQHRMNHGQWHAGAQDLDDSDNAYEIMRRKLARPNLPNSTSNRLPEQMSQSRGGPSRQHLHTSQTLTHVKNEPGTPSTPSSDGELRRPGLSSQKERHPMPNRTPSYILPESSSTSDRKPLTLGQVQEAAAAGMTDICTRCHEPFSNASQPCIYHPGRTMKKENGDVVWNCCEQGILSAGCDIVARHIGIDDEIEDRDIPRKRPSASPAPDSARQKRPRAFEE